MNEHMSSIPTNIITGFLGVGKTSAILHLLKNKPLSERWAVLVNEFGEIGVDGSLFEGRHPQHQGIFIREVPGGCMCCAAGLPMQIALNQLLTKAKPDRLLIEPTGLGHPIEVLEVLSADHNREILSLEKILTLLDARKLHDQRYTSHETFNQQIAIADVVVGNKQDLCTPEDFIALTNYVNKIAKPDVPTYLTSHGAIDFNWLTGATAQKVNSRNKGKHHEHKIDASAEPTLPSSGYLKAENSGEGYKSVGWRFDPTIIFCYGRLFAFLSGLQAERMKAVFITDKGVLGYNLTSDALSEFFLDDCVESRIEIIALDILDDWEKQLMACRISELSEPEIVSV